jgi:hypothetical protein
MRFRTRRTLPALLLASVLPLSLSLSLSSCAAEPGGEKGGGSPTAGASEGTRAGGDGAGRPGVGSCDERSYLVLAVLGGLEGDGTGSLVNTAKDLGSERCSLSKVANLLLVGEDDA